MRIVNPMNYEMLNHYPMPNITPQKNFFRVKKDKTENDIPLTPILLSLQKYSLGIVCEHNKWMKSTCLYHLITTFQK